MTHTFEGVQPAESFLARRIERAPLLPPQLHLSAYAPPPAAFERACAGDMERASPPPQPDSRAHFSHGFCRGVRRARGAQYQILTHYARGGPT